MQIVVSWTRFFESDATANTDRTVGCPQCFKDTVQNNGFLFRAIGVLFPVGQIWICVDFVYLHPTVDDPVVDAAEIDAGYLEDAAQNILVWIMFYVVQLIGYAGFRFAIGFIAARGISSMLVV